MRSLPGVTSPPHSPPSRRGTSALELVLGGDVMLGRGVDQILPHPSSPEIFEDYIRDARDYVTLAERRNGRIPRSVPFDYPWGDALADLRSADVRIDPKQDARRRRAGALGNRPCLQSGASRDGTRREVREGRADADHLRRIAPPYLRRVDVALGDESRRDPETAR